ncbi:hypothetical protein AURDEDRAFT_175757 [Auricularia subglabra TFB-10046 SS5]|uniref:DUF6533 domain-containing protein n=1 Tax=Auricularia subglabra (strain TFB-10046 / SS5) TaxID=717982 RepID=J0CWZ6_AURST|nr:hypothetical protein AURDEDRAFT_175757 [Auricularia subglabra TFB-10046 SS5]
MNADQLAHVELLVRSLQRSLASQYLDVISAVLFIWDHIVTFDQEVELVWPSRWGAGKILFLLVRYITWPDVLSSMSKSIFHLDAAVCQPLFEYVVWSTIIGIAAAEMILVLRTWAIWGGQRLLLAILTTVLSVGAGACCYVAKIYISRTHFISADTISPHLRGCFVTASTNMIAGPWIALTAFDFAILVLTMIKGVQHFRNGSSGIIVSLYRDGLLYFIYLFTISLANILVLYLAPAEYTILLAELQRVLYAMLSCRIVLHLRAAPQVPSTGSDSPARVASKIPGFRTRDEGGASAWFGNIATSSWDSEATDAGLCVSK